MSVFIDCKGNEAPSCQGAMLIDCKVDNGPSQHVSVQLRKIPNEEMHVPWQDWQSTKRSNGCCLSKLKLSKCHADLWLFWLIRKSATVSTKLTCDNVD